MRAQCVLVVDDEPRVREVVANYLEREGFRVVQAADAESARHHLATAEPDLVILDVMFPGASGFDLLAEMRRESQIPVIMLTARAGEDERVLGLELGSDDYVVKPFSPRELVARVRSVMRRSNPLVLQPLIECGPLVIDTKARRVTVAGEGVELASKEFELLAFLASNPGKAFSRNDLLREVWDSSTEWQDPATVTVHVRRIRNKIEDDPAQPRWIETVWGIGYRFEP